MMPGPEPRYERDSFLKTIDLALTLTLILTKTVQSSNPIKSKIELAQMNTLH